MKIKYISKPERRSIKDYVFYERKVSLGKGRIIPITGDARDDERTWAGRLQGIMYLELKNQRYYKYHPEPQVRPVLKPFMKRRIGIDRWQLPEAS